MATAVSDLGAALGHVSLPSQSELAKSPCVVSQDIYSSASISTIRPDEESATQVHHTETQPGRILTPRDWKVSIKWSNIIGAALYLSGSVCYLPSVYNRNPTAGPALFVFGSVLYMPEPLLRSAASGNKDQRSSGGLLWCYFFTFLGALLFLLGSSVELWFESSASAGRGAPWVPASMFLTGSLAFTTAPFPSAWEMMFLSSNDITAASCR